MKSGLNIKVGEIHEAGHYTLERTGGWCGIVSLVTGKRVLEAAEMPSPSNKVIAYNENGDFISSEDSILITIKEGKPVAISSEGEEIFGR